MPDWRRRFPLGWLILLALAGAAWWGWGEFKAYEAAHPEEFPWTDLSLADPVGAFTGDKLSAIADDPAHCTALIDAAALGDTTGRSREAPPPCGYDSGVLLGSNRPDYAGLVTACPVAAALALWERDVVQPAARDILGSEVTAIAHFGSYNCRRLYGRADGPWSAHATASAIDVTGFTLADGRRLSVLDDWAGEGEEAAFLRTVRDGTCRLFRTTLSPDYNEAHRDHLHLEMASGVPGWSACR